MKKPTKNDYKPQNCDLFYGGANDKLSTACVEDRESIIRYYAKNPKAIFFVSLSGGSDSMAMNEVVSRLIPKERIVTIHAHLGSVEHAGVIEYIKENIDHDLNIVKHDFKNFVTMVLLRKYFPSAKYRLCTSELKTGPIFKFIRRYFKENPQYSIGFNCTGLRSLESKGRALKNPLVVNKDLSLKSGKRTVYTWMPVFHLTKQEVEQTIFDAGRELHPVYQDAYGNNERLSCQFCVLGSSRDLKNAALNNPEHYAEMLAVERIIGHTMFGRSKVIRTSRPMIKGDILEGYEVTKCRILKRQVEQRNVYSNTVFVPVSLSDKCGVAVDEVAVAREVVRLQHLQKETEQIQASIIKQRKINSETKKAATNRKINKDTRTIDIFEVA